MKTGINEITLKIISLAIPESKETISLKFSPEGAGRLDLEMWGVIVASCKLGEPLHLNAYTIMRASPECMSGVEESVASLNLMLKDVLCEEPEESLTDEPRPVFLILWHGVNEWEVTEGDLAQAHKYATMDRRHLNYSRTGYSIIQCDHPVALMQAPESSQESPPESLPWSALNRLSEDLRSRISWGLYDGIEQFFIVGVDGSLAQLGNHLPDDLNELREWVASADKEHAKLIKFMKSDVYQPVD